MKDIQDILAAAVRQPDEPRALATLVRTSGSTYRRPGARMLVARDGRTIGALSGGCLEDDVARRSLQVIDTGAAALVAYDTRPLFGCEGLIEVLIEPLPSCGTGAVLPHFQRCFAARENGAVATVLATTAPDQLPLGSFPVAAASIVAGNDGPLRAAARAQAWAAFSSGHSQVVTVCAESAMAEIFVHVFPPPIRLLIAGSGPDARPLFALAGALGWPTTLLVHPAETFAREDFAGVAEIVIAHPEQLHLTPDPQTAAVVMTHNYGRDLAFLRALLPLPIAYLGLLGPKRRREKLLADLAEHAPLTLRESSGHLHSPAGLDLGAEAPAEVALSIIGEIQAVVAGYAAGFLRDRKGPIHAPPAAEARRAAA